LFFENKKYEKERRFSLGVIKNNTNENENKQKEVRECSN